VDADWHGCSKAHQQFHYIKFRFGKGTLEAPENPHTPSHSRTWRDMQNAMIIMIVREKREQPENNQVELLNINNQKTPF
jgi:hypothetical protein